MRKLLLATVAGLSVSMGMVGFADAQSFDAQDDSGQAFPTPGSVTVRLNGRVRFYADYMPDAREVATTVANTPVVAGAVTGTPTVSGNAQGAGTNKIATYSFQEYARLYPGFDGVAANGLKYGAAIEIRVGAVNAANNSNGQGLASAGGGLGGSVGGQSVSRNTLYLRRSFGYVGTDQLGTVRLGETDGPTSLYTTGTFENYADGNFNGDVIFQMPSSQQLVWPFLDVSNEYTSLKAVYLSPQLYGFDFGVSFEPNTGEGNGSTGCAQAASIGCDQLTSTSTYETQRRRNTFEGLLRYRGTFGGFGVAATGAYVTSGKVNDDGTPRRPVQFQSLDIGDAGLTVTYGGLTVGGHVLGGTTNNNGVLTLQKVNGKPEFAWIAGASYTVGPVIVGASYVDVVSEGSNGNLNTGVDVTGQRREQGISVGTTYSVAPGFALFASYQYAQRKEGNYDFVTGALDANHNKIVGQVLGIGTSFAW